MRTYVMLVYAAYLIFKVCFWSSAPLLEALAPGVGFPIGSLQPLRSRWLLFLWKETAGRLQPLRSRWLRLPRLRRALAFALASASCEVLRQVRWIRAALAFALAAVSLA